MMTSLSVLFDQSVRPRDSRLSMMIYLFNLINDEYKLVIGNYTFIESLYLSLHRLLGPTCILMRENAPSAIIYLVVLMDLRVAGMPRL